MRLRVETGAGTPGRAVASRWFAVLGAAGAWFAHLNLMYLFVPVACRHDLLLLFHVTTVALLAVGVASGLTAVRLWRHAGGSGRDERGDTGLLARTGALMAPLFLLTISLMWASTLVVDPCGR